MQQRQLVYNDNGNVRVKREAVAYKNSVATYQKYRICGEEEHFLKLKTRL